MPDQADTAWAPAFGPLFTGLVTRMRPAGTDLYAVGNFSWDGGATSERVARWDGTTWHSLGIGAVPSVYDVAVIGSDVYVCGAFTEAGGVSANRIAKLSGGTWSALGTGADWEVVSLEVIGTTLYAAGYFTEMGGVTGTQGIAQWDGSSWSAMGIGLNNGGTVSSMTVFGNDLIVSGNFTSISGVTTPGVARWDGSSWNGFDAASKSGGGLVATPTRIFGAWEEWFLVGGTMTVWESHLSGYPPSPWGELAMQYGGSGDESTYYIQQLAAGGNDLYVCGSLTNLSIPGGGSPDLHNLGRYDGSSWSSLGSGTDGPTRSLAFLGDDLYVTGTFDSAGNQSFARSARWRLGRPPEWTWARSLGSTSNDYPWTGVSDDSGNFYVTGFIIAPSIDFGFGTVTSAGGADMFLLKYDPDGNLLWARTAGGGSDDYGLGIAFDPNGAVVVTGGFASTTMMFDSYALNKPGTGSDAFTAKYDRAGNILWAKACGGSGADFAYAAGVDGAGNVYTAGTYGGPTLQFASLPALVSNGGSDMFLVKYGPGGNELRSRGDGGDASDGITSMAVDASGSLTCAGSFSSSTLQFGANPILSNSGAQDFFVARFDTAGLPVWSKSGGGPGGENARSVRLDPWGNAYLAGSFTSTSFTLGGTTLANVDPAGNATDAFLARYSPDGDVLWALSAGGMGVEDPSSLAVDEAGSVFMGGGSSSRRFAIAGTTLINPFDTRTQPFVAKYDSGGKPSWVQYASSAESEVLVGLARDPAGNLLVLGAFTADRAGFGTDTVVNTTGGTQDLYVAKLGAATGGIPVEADISLLAGWNLVSLPVVSAEDSVAVLFPGAVSPAYPFFTSGYGITATMVPGTGYWIKYPTAAGVNVTGGSIPNLTVDVSAGWNLIGSVTPPIDDASVTSTPPGLVTSNFFGYASSYEIADSLFPGKGYWVKVSADGQLHLGAGAANPKAASVSRFAAAGKGPDVTDARGPIRIVPTSELPPPPPVEAEASGASPGLPDRYFLEQNYPNPFNPTTLVRYQLPEKAHVTIRIFNLVGETVATLADGIQAAGFRSVEWDARGSPSGVYFCRMEAGGFVDTRKLILLR